MRTVILTLAVVFSFVGTTLLSPGQVEARSVFLNGVKLDANVAMKPQTFTGCDVLMEDRIPEQVRTGLAQKGHDIRLQGPFSSMVGGGQSVMRDDAARVNFGGSDPRKDGAAIPEPFPY